MSASYDGVSVYSVSPVATPKHIAVVHMFDTRTAPSPSIPHAAAVAERLSALFQSPTYKVVVLGSICYESSICSGRDVAFEGALLNVARTATVSMLDAERTYIFMWRNNQPQEYVLSAGVVGLMKMGGYYLNFLSKEEFCPSDRTAFEACTPTPERPADSSIFDGRSLSRMHHMLTGFVALLATDVPLVHDVPEGRDTRGCGATKNGATLPHPALRHVPLTSAVTPDPVEQTSKVPHSTTVNGEAGISNLALPSASSAVAVLPLPRATPSTSASVPALEVAAAQSVPEPKKKVPRSRRNVLAAATNQMEVPKARKPRVRTPKPPPLPPPVWPRRQQSASGSSQAQPAAAPGAFAQRIRATCLPEAARIPHGAIPASIPPVESAGQAESSARDSSRGTASGSQRQATDATAGPKRSKKPRKAARRDPPVVDAAGAGVSDGEPAGAAPRGKGKKRAREEVETETAAPMRDHPSPKRFARDLPRGVSKEAEARPVTSEPQVSEESLPQPSAIAVADPQRADDGTEDLAEVETPSLATSGEASLFSDDEDLKGKESDDLQTTALVESVDDAEQEPFEDFLATAFVQGVETGPTADGSPESSDFSSSDSDEE